MSYILEALKKAQAERQLGDLPTIHAPALHTAAAPKRSGVRPVMLVLGAMGVAIAVLLALVWRQGQGDQPAALAGQQAVPSAAPQLAAPAPAVQQSLTVAQQAAQPAAPPAQQTAQQPVQQTAQQPVQQTAQQPVQQTAPQPVQQTAPQPARPAVAAPVPVPLPSTMAAANMPAPTRPAALLPAKPASAPAAASAAMPVAKSSTTQPSASGQAAAESAPQEETTQSLRDLPEPIQRAIPPISVGGYIYSRNPADRLLLIDKVLRHEGEELAPGLTLEKLLPKAAVFNYKGYRYRVPY